MAFDPRLIHLHPTDNVVTAATVLLAGAPILLGGGPVTPAESIALGFKVAARDIGIGEKIIKWGVPIGSATAPIVAGAVVHLHNMQSDYLPTFTLDGERRYVAEHQ